MAFVLASSSGADPVGQFSILQLTITLSLAGITGIESLFFGDEAAKLSGYGDLAGPRSPSSMVGAKPKRLVRG